MFVLSIDLPPGSKTAKRLRKQKEATGKMELPEPIRVHEFEFAQGELKPFTITLNAAYIVLTPGIVARLAL